MFYVHVILEMYWLDGHINATVLLCFFFICCFLLHFIGFNLMALVKILKLILVKLLSILKNNHSEWAENENMIAKEFLALLLTTWIAPLCPFKAVSSRIVIFSMHKIFKGHLKVTGVSSLQIHPTREDLCRWLQFMAPIQKYNIICIHWSQEVKLRMWLDGRYKMTETGNKHVLNLWIFI